METDAHGSPYEAHVRKEDGTEVVVEVNEALAVTSAEEHVGGKGGHRGPGRGGQAPNLLPGEAAEKATAAASATVQGGPEGAGPGGHGGRRGSGRPTA